MASLTHTAAAAESLPVDSLVVFLQKKGDSWEIPGIQDSLADSLIAAVKRLHPDEKITAPVVLPGIAGISAPKVVVAHTEKSTAESVRETAGAATRAASGEKIAVAASGDAPLDAVCEGAALGAYECTRITSTPEKPVKEVTICAPAEQKSIVTAANDLAASQNWARDLVNLPPSILHPVHFAELVQEAMPKNVSVEVLNVPALIDLGCGGIVGVGQGSANPPRLVVLRYQPEEAAKHLAWVGKGITFDSGGLNLKPTAAMATMKCDMGGAAAVAAAIKSVALAQLPVEVTAYLCLAENMTGSNAQRPSDVVTMQNGVTVEIDNTDAEGRLVMADGLSLASRLQPAIIVDVATLTGAAMVALGERTAAFMANGSVSREQISAAIASSAEDFWELPLRESLGECLKSQVADTMNTGSRMGGAIVAGLFLQKFIGDDAEGQQLPWAHLDIASPGWNNSAAYGYTPKGGTGFAVRTLHALAEQASK